MATVSNNEISETTMICVKLNYYFLVSQQLAYKIPVYTSYSNIVINGLWPS